MYNGILILTIWIKLDKYEVETLTTNQFQLYYFENLYFYSIVTQRKPFIIECLHCCFEIVCLTQIIVSRKAGHWIEFVHIAKGYLLWPCDGSVCVESAFNAEDSASVPGLGRSPGEGNGNLIQYSYQGNPWTEEPGGLESIGSQRVRRNLATKPPWTQLRKSILICSTKERKIVPIAVSRQFPI